MGPIDQLAASRARAAYEWGRLWRSLQVSWLAVPVTAIGLLHAPRWSAGVTVSVGVAVFALLTLFSWRGQSWERAVGPGLLAGAVLLGLPALEPRSCFYSVAGQTLPAFWILCPLAGLLAGALLGALTSRQEADRAPFALAAAALAALIGSFGCALAGAGGAVGMIAGSLLAGVPAFLIARPVTVSPPRA